MRMHGRARRKQLERGSQDKQGDGQASNKYTS